MKAIVTFFGSNSSGNISLSCFFLLILFNKKENSTTQKIDKIEIDRKYNVEYKTECYIALAYKQCLFESLFDFDDIEVVNLCMCACFVSFEYSVI